MREREQERQREREREREGEREECSKRMTNISMVQTTFVDM